MRDIFAGWRAYKSLDERINTLDSGRRFINDSLAKVTDEQKRIPLTSRAIESFKKWGDLKGDPDFLGSGSKGSAYLFDKKVLKITSDDTEYRAAKMIAGKEHPNVYTIYKAQELPVEFRPLENQRYAIVYSYLEYPNRLMVDVAELMFHKIKKDKFYYQWKESYLSEAENLIKQFLNALSKDSIVLTPSSNKWDSIEPKIDSISNTLGWDELQKRLFTEFWTLSVGMYNSTLSDSLSATEHANKVLSDPRSLYLNQLASGLTFLYDNGIIFNDLKTSNIMEKNGQIAIIDIGYANFR
tara:strand:- start:71920 stop:72810 length:891 start_codon:yes stop_codon:yes gene_type:complete